MVKEIMIGIGGVAVGAVAIFAIYALVKYIKKQKELDITPERAYSDEVSVNEIKEWFSEKIYSEDEVGVLFYPTQENLNKWDLDIKLDNNIIIQMVYNQKGKNVICYREIAFSKMSEKLKELLENNGGTLVLEK